MKSIAGYLFEQSRTEHLPRELKHEAHPNILQVLSSELLLKILINT